MSVKTYKKNENVKLSTNFSSKEFNCKGKGCCSETKIDTKLVEYLQQIRDHFDRTVKINSAYRCPTHNAKVGGAKNSKHTQGMAADIVVKNVAPPEVAKYAESIGIKGIGLYDTSKDGHFCHIDTRTKKFFWKGKAQTPVETFGGKHIEYKYNGCLDSVTHNSISGWAWDGVDDAALEIHVYIYDSKGDFVKGISNIIANQFRQDLKDAGIGNGYHAFDYKYDFDKLPDDTYKVKAFLIGGNNPCIGEKDIVVKHMTYVGNLENPVDSCAKGWAWNSINDIPVEVHLYIYDSEGKEVLGIPGIIADKFRQDLKDSGIGDGCHAFLKSYEAALSKFGTGTYTMRAYAINAEGGDNPLLGEKTFEFVSADTNDNQPGTNSPNEDNTPKPPEIDNGLEGTPETGNGTQEGNDNVGDSENNKDKLIVSLVKTIVNAVKKLLKLLD